MRVIFQIYAIFMETDQKKTVQEINKQINSLILQLVGIIGSHTLKIKLDNEFSPEGFLHIPEATVSRQVLLEFLKKIYDENSDN